jgi:ABC-type dipeptide/oligopeptide/nickel transport system permease subunit
MALVDEYGDDLAVMMIYGVAIALYTLAVAILYVPMGTRMMFARRFGERRVATPARRFAYVVTFPLLSFLFVLVIAVSMFFMARFSTDALSHREVLTIAMAVVLAIRVCAYFSEHAASDLAKVMPLSMLAVVLVTNGVSDLEESLENLQRLDDDPMLLLLFFVVVVVVEFVLRVTYELLGRPGHGRDPRDPAPGLQKKPKA